MALREILHYQKTDVLRKKSRPVEKIDTRVLQLLDDLIDTLQAAEGAGLAAPQVGILKRVAVVDIGEGLIELINPIVVKRTGEQTELEGCLSIPNVTGEVSRPMEVTVEALNRNGEKVIHKGKGFLARAFCHEIDHLDGILFIDKMKGE